MHFPRAASAILSYCLRQITWFGFNFSLSAIFAWGAIGGFRELGLNFLLSCNNFVVLKLRLNLFWVVMGWQHCWEVRFFRLCLESLFEHLAESHGRKRLHRCNLDITINGCLSRLRVIDQGHHRFTRGRTLRMAARMRNLWVESLFKLMAARAKFNRGKAGNSSRFGLLLVVGSSMIYTGALFPKILIVAESL